MNTTTAEKLAAAGADQTFPAWLDQVRAFFPVREEFSLACEIYSFATAFEDGKTPTQAYADFDEWANCEVDYV
jgi:hypothetical protein